MIMIIALMIKPARLFWMDDLSEGKMNDSSWWHATLVSLSVILPMSKSAHSLVVLLHADRHEGRRRNDGIIGNAAALTGSWGPDQCCFRGLRERAPRNIAPGLVSRRIATTAGGRPDRTNL